MAGEAIAFGPGKADLLDAIIAEGSISGAGRALGMSYRRAWLLVDAMNHAWAEPLVETRSGKHKGAGVTEFGRTILSRYRQLDRALSVVADEAASDLLGRLRSAPLSSRRGFH